mmetsp:Transcript_27831/g.89572  ORF Transcript_27831/g.89572 Transcript_27831/m.89572 type:complete len:598 (-) Transcript_27831:170-1963(-)
MVTAGGMEQPYQMYYVPQSGYTVYAPPSQMGRQQTPPQQPQLFPQPQMLQAVPPPPPPLPGAGSASATPQAQPACPGGEQFVWVVTVPAPMGGGCGMPVCPQYGCGYGDMGTGTPQEAYPDGWPSGSAGYAMQPFGQPAFCGGPGGGQPEAMYGGWPSEASYSGGSSDQWPPGQWPSEGGDVHTYGSSEDPSHAHSTGTAAAGGAGVVGKDGPGGRGGAGGSRPGGGGGLPGRGEEPLRQPLKEPLQPQQQQLQQQSAPTTPQQQQQHARYGGGRGREGSALQRRRRRQRAEQRSSQDRRPERGGSRASSAAANASLSAELMAQLNAGGAQLAKAIAKLREPGITRRLSFEAAGCRTVQLALDIADRQAASDLASALKGHIAEAIRSPHANYVLQKVIKVLTPQETPFIVAEMSEAALEFVRHEYGCRIFCRLLEHAASEPDVARLVDDVLQESDELLRHTFGHHVVECALEHGQQHQRQRIFAALRRNLMRNAWNRNAAYVVEKALLYGNPDERDVIACDFLENSASDLAALGRSQFGSMVMRALLRLPGETSQKLQDLLSTGSAQSQLRATKHGRRLMEDHGMATSKVALAAAAA